jgi:hypothetical protein
MARIEDEKKKLYTPYTPSQNQENYVEAKPATTAQPTTTFKPSANVDAAQKFLQSVKDNGYNQQWSKQLDALVNEYMGRGPFQYNQNEDVMWQQAKKTGLDAANLAMRDTTAQAAALSGGYGNSYAATVGQQVYNKGVADIMAMAPEYYQAAYQRYKDEGDTMLQNIGLVQSMDDAAYARYADALNRAQSDYDTLYGREYGEFLDKRNFDYQLGRDTVADQRYETEWDYNVGRDQIADDRYKAEWEHQLEREGIEDERYNTQWEHQLEREGIEDERYASEIDYRSGRDFVEDSRYSSEQTLKTQQNAYDRLASLISTTGYKPSDEELSAAGMSRGESDSYGNYYTEQQDRYQTEQDYKVLKEQYDALVDEKETQAKEDEKKTAAYEKVLSSPKYASASRALKQTLEGPYKNSAERTNAVSNQLYTMWMNGDFGNGEEALLYVEALADELGLDYMDVLGRE